MRAWWIAMVAGSVALALSGASQALDRDASMIDSIGVKLAPFDHSDGLSGFILGEQAVQNSGGQWAFLLGGQYGTVCPEFIEEDFWSATAGLKWCPLPPTSIAATFTYGQYDLPENPDYRSVALELKQRLLPADAALSPYIILGGNVHSSDDFYEPDGPGRTYHEKTTSDLAATAGAGLDVSMTEDMVIVVDAVYTAPENLEDGWVLGLSMKYYWP